MSEAMEEIERLKDEVDELTRDIESLDRCKADAELQLGQRDEEIAKLDKVIIERDAELRRYKKANDEFAELERAKGREILELKEELRRLRETDDLVRYNALLEERKVELDGRVKELEHLLDKRQEYAERLEHRVGQLEDRESKLNEAVALWKGKVDRGETWDSFEAKVVELLNAEGRVALKRLAAFMRWSLKMTRRVNELEEKNLELDMEAEHLASVIDAKNATSNGATPEEFERATGEDDGAA